MKKIYTIIAFFLFAAAAIAQSNKNALGLNLSNQQKCDPQIPEVINRTLLARQHVLGDTVFVFDGYYSYNWNGTLPGSFALKLEDLDTLTIEPKLQPYFGTKGSFSAFYEINPTSKLLYKHKDSVFYLAATSWFAPVGKANNWLEMGPIKVPAIGGTLKWRHNIPDNADYRDGYEVLVNTTGLGSTNFTSAPIFSVTDKDPLTKGDTVNFPYNVFVQYAANLTPYAGQDIYIAFHHTANDQFVLRITDVILTEGYNLGVNENNNIIYGLQNMPNPAINNTMINYSLKETANVELTLFDVAGKKISTLNQGRQSLGDHQLKLDASALSSGVYFYTLSAGDYKSTNKMTVVK